MKHPVSPCPGWPWVQGEPSLLVKSKTPTYRDPRGRGMIPTLLPRVPSLQPPIPACAVPSKAGGLSCPTHGVQTPPFSCCTPSQWETGPRGSSEACFTPSSWTLLLPGSLGGRRHRAQPRCCSPHPSARTSPWAAYTQADASAFSLRFRSLPQTAGAKRGQALGWGRRGKGAARPTLRYEPRGAPIPGGAPIPPGDSASWHPVLREGPSVLASRRSLLER